MHLLLRWREHSRLFKRKSFFISCTTWKKSLPFRCCIEKFRNLCVCVCTHTHTLHNLWTHFNLCLNPLVYVATVTKPTPLLVVSSIGSSRHTFLWFRGWSSLHFWWMFWQVLLYPRANEKNVCVTHQEMMKNAETCTHTVRVVWLQPWGTQWIEPVLVFSHCVNSHSTANSCYSMESFY